LKSLANEDLKEDIRHCYADATKAQKLLNFKSTITLQNGLTELAEWARTHGWGAVDLFEKALKELRERPSRSSVAPQKEENNANVIDSNIKTTRNTTTKKAR